MLLDDVLFNIKKESVVKVKYIVDLFAGWI